MAVDWTALEDAYGSAGGIPALLIEILSFPEESHWQGEPWFSLWSALYHQGDIYSASLAAIPEIVATLSTAPDNGTLSFFLLPASIAVADHEHPVDVAPEIRRRFEESMLVLGSLAAVVHQSTSDDNLSRASRAAILASQRSFDEASELLDSDS